MADQKNRGVSKALASVIVARRPHESVQADDETLAAVQRTVPGATYASIAAALCYLKDKGLLVPTGVAGVYEKPNGKSRPKAELTPDVEQVAIDNLLTAMAEAEPVLRRCKKLLAALDAIK